MKRRKHLIWRRLIDCALVLALLVAIGILVRSYFVPPEEDFGPSPEGLSIELPSGLFAIEWLQGELILYEYPDVLLGARMYHLGFYHEDHFWWGQGLGEGRAILGFRAFSEACLLGNGKTASVHALALPLAVVVGALLAICVFRGYVTLRVLRRLIAGACVQCGYDLRAGPIRCPECGLPVATPGAGMAARE